MVLINNVHELVMIYGSATSSKLMIIVPVYKSSKLHHCADEISFLYVRFHDLDVEYIIVISHSDIDSNITIQDLQFLNKSTIYTLNFNSIYRIFPYSDIYDLNFNQYLMSNENISLYSLLGDRIYTSWYIDDLYYTSMVKIVQSIKDKLKEIKLYNVPDKMLIFYKKCLECFAKIECNGIHVDRNRFLELYPNKEFMMDSNDLTYTEYNLYTKAGRPSSRFGGVNFSSLESGVNKNFITSRFDNGAIVVYDYSSYHLTLLANLIGYDTPDKNMHRYLCKQYFGEVTDENYKKTKEINFRVLYGGIPNELLHIPFFQKSAEYIDFVWNEFDNNTLKSPISGRTIFVNSLENTKNKVFNYLIQLLETENNVIVMNRLQNALREYKTKLIMYTYDSFAFDFSFEDGKELLKKMKDIIECRGDYISKIMMGYDYDNLENITQKLI